MSRINFPIDTRGPLEKILSLVQSYWPGIVWTFRLDDTSDGYILRGRQHGMWAMRLIDGKWHTYRDLLSEKVLIAGGDIAAHLASFDATIKRLRWHAPRRAR